MPGVQMPPGRDDKSLVDWLTSILAAETADLADGIFTLPVSIPRERYRLGSPSPKAETSSPRCRLSPPATFSHQLSDDNVSPFSAPPVLLRVGGPQSPSRETQPVTFFVHEKLLTTSSLFFRSALCLRSSAVETSNHSTYSFAEAQTRTVSLPEDRPDDVRLFIRWLYSGSSLGIFPPSPDLGSEPGAQPSQITPICPTARIIKLLPRYTFRGRDTIASLQQYAHYQHQRKVLLSANRRADISALLPPRPTPPAFGPWIRLYLFADRYQVGFGLRDFLCDIVREVAWEGNCVPNAEDVSLLWSNTTGDCGMRRLVVDLYVGKNTTAMVREGDGVWNQHFMTDLVERMGKGLRFGWKSEWKREAEAENLKGRSEGGDDGVEVVRIGILWRWRCAYHDHQM